MTDDERQEEVRPEGEPEPEPETEPVAADETEQPEEKRQVDEAERALSYWGWRKGEITLLDRQEHEKGQEARKRQEEKIGLREPESEKQEPEESVERTIVVGPLRRMIEVRHGQHVGQEGLPQGGSQPGYTHVPGSVGGAASEISGTREVGLSPHRGEQFSETEEYSEIARFLSEFQEIEGAEVLAAHTANGAFKESPDSETEYELSLDLVYEGNGDAEAIINDNAKGWDQFGAFIFSGERLTSAQGQRSQATRFMFEEPVNPTLRGEIERTLAENGTNGFIWKQRGGKDVLVAVAIPQWGYTRNTHRTSMRAANEYLSSQNVKYGSWSRNGWIITAKKDDGYEWK